MSRKQVLTRLWVLFQNEGLNVQISNAEAGFQGAVRPERNRVHGLTFKADSFESQCRWQLMRSIRRSDKTVRRFVRLFWSILKQKFSEFISALQQ
jgi:hypothetical protein